VLLLLLRELAFTLNTDGCPEFVRMFVAELLEREAAMLIAFDKREAGIVVCPARDCTEAAPFTKGR
jgi:hypothetical protein